MDPINNAKMSDEAHAMLKKRYHDCLEISRLEKEAEATANISGGFNQVQYCPTRFDGWLCWNKTPVDTVATQGCPYFIDGFTKNNLVYRICQPDGTWFVHPESQKEWSNYSTCVDLEDMHFREIVNDLYLAGYFVSLLALLISLCIFFGFRSLRCTRIKIHIQLFSSLIINCFLWITWYLFVVDVPDVIKDNPRWCVIMHLLIHYFMLANYMWMFCEGLHLHLVLVVVFVKDNIALRWFYLVGWGVPLVVMILYGYSRAQYSSETQQCWMHESYLNWILTIPVIISLFASLLFLINVIRVLLTKLHPCSGNPAPVGMRKAARAMFILVPLFGLQNVVLPLRPDPGSVIEPYYQVSAAILISLQGLCVSILFCFVNHDVMFAIKCYACKRFPELFSQVTRDTSNVPITPSRDAILREQIMYDTRLSCTTT